jgi:hypothetical protein
MARSWRAQGSWRGAGLELLSREHHQRARERLDGMASTLG